MLALPRPRLTARAQLVAIGESPHWTVGPPAVVAALLEQDCTPPSPCFSLVVFEEPYSATALLDAYVMEERSPEAEELLEQIKGEYPIFLSSDLDLLRSIRDRNRSSTHKIHAAGCDIEHDPRTVRRRVSQYADASIGADDRSLSEILDDLKARGSTDPALLRTVQNGIDGEAAYANGLSSGARAGSLLREQFMIRNLSDPEWLGSLWRTGGRVLYFGGDAHTGTGADCDPERLACSIASNTGVLAFSITVQVLRENITPLRRLDHCNESVSGMPTGRKSKDSASYWLATRALSL